MASLPLFVPVPPPLTETDRHPTRGRARLAGGLGALALAVVLSACGGGGQDNSSTAQSSSDTAASSASSDELRVEALAVAEGSTTLAQALAAGDASGVSLATVQRGALAQLRRQESAYTAARQALFGLAADGSVQDSSVSGISWDPSHDSVTFNLLDRGRNQALLTGNWRYSDSTAGTGRVLGVLGQLSSTKRYAAFGGNPLAVAGNAAMDSAMRNTVAWLTGRSNFDNFKVVTAHLPGSTTYWFPHEAKVRAWFASQFPSVTLNGMTAAAATASNAPDDSCDGDKLAACLQGADLLVIGRMQGPSRAYGSEDSYPASYDGAVIFKAVKAAQAKGIPVLYLHHYRDANDLASRLLGYFGLSVTNNYWAQEGLSSVSPADVPSSPSGLAELRALLKRLGEGGFSSTWSGCWNDLGFMICDATSSAAGDTPFISEFLTPAKALRTRLRELDAKGLALFSQLGYQQEKLMVLLGDKYRASVSYPMTKEGSGLAFYRAYFSDMTAYLNRAHNQVAQNLGNFSGLFGDDVATVSRRVSVAAPASGTREHVSGLYVMPGRTVTLKRVDSSAATVTVGLNMLRDTTHVYNTYDRPTLLASPRVPMSKGQTLTFTSPFGGPLYLFVGAVSDGSKVAVQVEGATTHPVLRNMRNATQVAAFKAELDSTPTNWAVVTSDFLTIHSNLTHFRSTLAAHGGDMKLLSDRLWTYMVKDTYELAGFNSEETGTFTLPDSVTAYCTSAGWDCSGSQHRRDVMQHVIADRYAACGSGCSGNPYDQDWAVQPLGWGETHEIGHNLQRSHLKIYGGQSTEVSNNIFPMHKQMAFNRANPTATPLTRSVGATKAVFSQLTAAAATTDPQATMKANIWTSTTYAANNAQRLAFYRQLVEFARTHNSGFTDGWELYTLMHLLDRNFAASSTSANWASVKDGLGFGTYASYPSSIDGNDFMLIAASRLIGRDMRPVFAMWGVSYSDAASAQVAAYGLSEAPKVVYPMTHFNQYGSGVGAPVVVTSTATYPSGY